MAKPKRKTPFDPAAQARQALERQDRESEIKRLEGQGVVVNLDQGRRIVSAYRSNVFKILLEARTITQNHHNAAHTLMTDWAEWKGLDGKPGGPGGGSGAAELVSDRMINAGRRVTSTLSQVGPMDRDLLVAFMVATVEEDRPMAWRGIVQRETGVIQSVRQSQMVVAALENLRRVYEAPRDQARVA